ncbi:hypothetical protein [Actinosynnema sp. NPDC023587]|uniref:NucA/NucB deoxyribonuclease domain-containing protein n=1 Tax=Actinosynnema sp. NPDC023587 TaxID=3154695 RepID=UPI0033C26A15
MGPARRGEMKNRRALFVAIVALLAVGLTPGAAGASSGGMRFTSVEFDAWGTSVNRAAAEDTGVASGLSTEFRSDKPNGRQELDAYLNGPKPARHVTRAADLIAEAGNPAATDAETPNPVSVDDCRQKFGTNIGKPQYWYRDRFNSCMVAAIQLKNKFCQNGQCSILGAVHYRLVIVGHGTRNVNPDGSRAVKFQWFTDMGGVDGGTPPPAWDNIYNGLVCKTYIGVTCGFDRGFGMATVAQLQAGWTSSVQTLTERNTSAEKDNKIYYDLGFLIRGGMGDIVSEKVQILRSDTASYAGSGGFVFMDVESWLQYDFSRPEIYQQVKHIWDAQNNIAATKPGIPLTKVAGSRGSGQMLTRMHPDYEKTRYDRNNYVAVLTCKQHWGNDYATNDPVTGERECDEYPYRSTYEGAAYTEYNGGAGIWSYSARPIRKLDNSIGGGLLSAFYLRDHVLHTDRFWVDIVGTPNID